MPELNRTILDNLALVVGVMGVVIIGLVVVAIVHSRRIRRANSSYRSLVSDSQGASLQQLLDNHLVDHLSELRIAERDRLLASVARGPCGLAGPQLSDQRVDPDVRPQRRPPLVAAQGGEQAALRQPSLAGVDRSVAHGRRWTQPALGAGRPPSTAIRIACASSSESWCVDSPLSTGLAKTRV